MPEPSAPTPTQTHITVPAAREVSAEPCRPTPHPPAAPNTKLCCKGCRKRWYADNPSWLEKLPKRFTNLLPAVLTHKKAICKSVLDELRRRGKSPTDMAKQITELMHLKYERADLAYLLSCKNIMDGEKRKVRTRRQLPSSFGRKPSRLPLESTGTLMAGTGPLCPHTT
ncbi:hypothetical protein KUCAC02_024876 [Chaenocephalus aceratus]|nr:hypothetical protein KUCAC02_024876 [Chaenocephalus aceratus]